VKLTRKRLRHRDNRSKLERRFQFLWLAVQGPELKREFCFNPTGKWRSVAAVDSRAQRGLFT
jgi:hypothetical protein